MSDPHQPPVPTWRERLELLAGGDVPDPLRVAGYLVGLAAMVVGGWLLLRESRAPVETTLPRASPPATATTTVAEVVVHASGSVARPGLYRLPVGARVADALAAAGGPLDGADVDRINLAAELADGTKVYVPRVGEPLPSGSDVATPAGPLDLNTATAEDLDELPGVGPATAKAIVDARTKLGRFRSVDDLLDVKGIGPAKLDAIRDLVRV